MIDVSDAQRLSARERFALDHLVDGSAILRVADGASRGATHEATQGAVASAVRLEVADAAEAPTLTQLARHPKKAFAASNGIVRVPRALLATVGDLLVRQSDLVAPRDRHDRPRSDANELVQAAVERRPVVSALAMELGHAVRIAAGERPVWSVAPWPGGARWAAALSHDLDVASLWPAFTLMRVAELLRKGDPRRAGRVLWEATRDIVDDPVRAGVDAVLDAEQRGKAHSTWFVICGTPTFSSVRAGDVTYLPESPRVRGILQLLAAAGHEVGLHGSLETVQNGERFRTQRTRLEALTGLPSVGARQHFLRRRVGHTEQAMAKAGFLYDSTCGFADRNGFRAGVADVFPLLDAASDVPVGLEEVPFCWMDRAQSKYQGVEDPARWIDEATDLADACEQVQGLWCGIWHPNLTPSLGFPGAPDAFAQLVKRLAARGPWFGTMDQIVRWRLGRRSLRVISASDAGPPTVRGDNAALRSAGHPYVILDGAGNAVAQVTGS